MIPIHTRAADLSFSTPCGTAYTAAQLSRLSENENLVQMTEDRQALKKLSNDYRAHDNDFWTGDRAKLNLLRTMTQRLGKNLKWTAQRLFNPSKPQIPDVLRFGCATAVQVEAEQAQQLQPDLEQDESEGGCCTDLYEGDDFFKGHNSLNAVMAAARALVTSAKSNGDSFNDYYRGKNWSKRWKEFSIKYVGTLDVSQANAVNGTLPDNCCEYEANARTMQRNWDCIIFGSGILAEQDSFIPGYVDLTSPLPWVSAYKKGWASFISCCDMVGSIGAALVYGSAAVVYGATAATAWTLKLAFQFVRFTVGNVATMLWNNFGRAPAWAIAHLVVMAKTAVMFSWTSIKASLHGVYTVSANICSYLGGRVYYHLIRPVVQYSARSALYFAQVLAHVGLGLAQVGYAGGKAIWHFLLHPTYRTVAFVAQKLAMMLKFIWNEVVLPPLHYLLWALLRLIAGSVTLFVAGVVQSLVYLPLVGLVGIGIGIWFTVVELKLFLQRHWISKSIYPFPLASLKRCFEAWLPQGARNGHSTDERQSGARSGYRTGCLEADYTAEQRRKWLSLNPNSF